MDRRRRTSFVAPRSPDLMPLGFILWGYLKNQTCNQRMNTLNELKKTITAAIANITKDRSQGIL
jgi:hypothetical protein